MNLKKFFLLLIAVATAAGVTAQKNIVNISGQAGTVLNTTKDKSFGLGGSVAWMHQDNYLAKSEKNYFTLTMKGFINPYEGGKFISCLLNDVDDGFNYINTLIGYRVAFRNVTDGFFIEPRLGAGLFASKKTSFVFSPMMGYAVKKIDIGAYCDMGFMKGNYAIGKNNFFTLGISVGYNIGL